MGDTGASSLLVKDSSNVMKSSPGGNRGLESSKCRRNRTLDWRNGVAGGVAGCAAKTIVAPMERIKILFQTSNPHFLRYSTRWNGLIEAVSHIRTSHGIYALFKGHAASLIRVFPYAGINFLAYEQLQCAIIVSPQTTTPYHRFFCGSTAGAIATVFTYPLELIRIRLAFETEQSKNSSWFRICRKIYFESGGKGTLLNLYQGIGPTMLGILPYAGTSFVTHDLMREQLRSPFFAPYTLEKGSSTRLTAVAQLCCGAIAGIVAQTVAYPIDILRRRMQVGSVVGSRSGVLETARRVVLERGVRGFYVGLTIGYVKMAPMAATSFYVYDRMKRLLGIIE
ncbi:mitochondrial carrier protein Leu5 [Aspergillus nomiae NRRL 13137]|uniref:Mitochondrial thiamine pyrophosphate carrier 1 n=1 Tax=Aspergillus nomiae NRRL (strain ATCC 15546 / NRRL 13137 / CBS 260.88 / M93) TaxID=1509407 RepID=A0A0L1IYZ9_ASPN3|nr:mitochondrial carrier protein Leu5 [Aspergillus nomiae NRRL 13137]KNG84781.1 mitochondrial carrier protein Leu5 [Aspergillus nomiae NRRL 13137]